MLTAHRTDSDGLFLCQKWYRQDLYQTFKTSADTRHQGVKTRVVEHYGERVHDADNKVDAKFWAFGAIR